MWSPDMWQAIQDHKRKQPHTRKRDTMTTNQTPYMHQFDMHACEVCGRPNAGAERCPHAIDPSLPCPHDPKRKQARQRMRNIGR